MVGEVTWWPARERTSLPIVLGEWLSGGLAVKGINSWCAGMCLLTLSTSGRGTNVQTGARGGESGPGELPKADDGLSD